MKRMSEINLYGDLMNRTTKIAVVGLGYVGLPIAVSFAKKVDVIGFDISEDKIECLKKGHDPTQEVGDDAVKATNVDFTSDERRLREARFIVIAVPTPISNEKIPDLTLLKLAAWTVGKNLSRDSIVVFESTVFPGATEEICIPILEEASKMIAGIDFKVGYSPERINPGDKKHRLETIVKVVSAMDLESLDIIAKTYELIVEAGVYRTESIKVAEAAKIIENAQRDINIAFMNELSVIFNRMNIDTKAVLRAAKTKWNFLDFSPGLVGGHCIGIDPYYLTYRAEQFGHHSQIILSGRRINDEMGHYVARHLVKNLIKAEVNPKEAKVAILGFTFKENCPDIRNTRVIDIVKELDSYGICSIICDPVASDHEVHCEYGLRLIPLEEVRDFDAIVIAVGHSAFTDLSFAQILEMYSDTKSKKKILFDVKGIYCRSLFEDNGFVYWSL